MNSSSSSSSKKSSARQRPCGRRTVVVEPPYHLYDDQHEDHDADGAGATDECGDGKAAAATKTATDVSGRKRRRRRTFQEGFDNVVNLLRGKKRIAVLTGAGISVSCGIPDFRSRNTGLYSTLDVEGLGLSCPEELFDYDFFHDDPRPFFKFARHLYFPGSVSQAAATAATAAGATAANTAADCDGRPTTSRPTPTPRKDETQEQQQQRYRARPSDSHKLLALLEERKMLLRVYSQNIDGLEEVAGVSSKKIVYAHGSLQWATCCRCRRKTGRKDIEADILQGSVARCKLPVVVKKIQKNKQQATMSSAATTSDDDNSKSDVNGEARAEESAAADQQQTATNTTALPRTPSIKPPIPQREPSARKRKRTKRMMHADLSGGGGGDEESDPNNSKGDDDDEEEGARNSNTSNPSLCGGVLKPGVTFFGEALHDQVRRCLESDRNKVDALIVIGTSLSVAPISKVIGYLPPNIPRILINRNVVHPAQPTTTSTATTETESSDHGGENEEDEEKDFRNDYVFDAYLLGYCDDVTRALGRKLFVATDASATDRNSSTACDTSSADDVDGEVLDCLVDQGNDDDSTDHDANTSGPFTCRAAWKRLALRIPPERVFLFPGAQPSSDSANSQADAEDAAPSRPTHREIAHCDGCSGRIDGTIRKCEVCFDYDLCEKCFPGLSKTHYDGKHHFVAEAACPEL